MFDWDEAIAHIAKPGVTPQEPEEAMTIGPIDVARQYYKGEERLLQVGVTSAARVLVVITTWGADSIRGVSAITAPASLQRQDWEERRQTYGD